MSLTQSSIGQCPLTYDKYFMMLQNACIRYDKTLKHKPSTTSRAVYQHEIDDDDPSIHDEEDVYLDEDFAPDGVETPSDDMYYVHSTNFKRTPHVKSLISRKTPGKPKPHKGIPPKPGYNGPVYLPKHIYNMLSEDIKKELDKYNQDKKVQYKPTCSRMAKVHEQDHEEVDDSPDHPEPDLENHFHEQSYPIQDYDIEDLLVTHTPYTLNMASTYHISKHSASSYGSLVDRGANGGLAGADVCVLERTGRKVSVTGIDDHELPGLDIVTCVALIQTNHGKVNMLMHEYAYYGRGNTIHSPCQIEWFNNTCDDKSHHVGGKQVISFLDGHATPLQCRSGLMYMSLLGKPTVKDLDQYPYVVLTSPHEWNPSVLDYSHPNTHGYPSWSPDPSAGDQHDPRIR